MAVIVLTNCKAWLDGYDVSGVLNRLGLEYASELQDSTVFGHDTRHRKGGLKNIKASLTGYADFDNDGIDEQLFDRIGVENSIFSASPDGGEAGEVGYTFRCIKGMYQHGGEVGAMYPFSSEAEGSDGVGLLRGIVGYNGTATIDGNGTAFQLGAVAAGQRLYAALHVLGVSASDSVVVKVQSDNAENFGSPTDQITFASKSAIGSDFQSVAGAITDDWWRVNIDVTGSSISIPIVVVLAIK